MVEHRVWGERWFPYVFAFVVLVTALLLLRDWLQDDLVQVDEARTAKLQASEVCP